MFATEAGKSSTTAVYSNENLFRQGRDPKSCARRHSGAKWHLIVFLTY